MNKNIRFIIPIITIIFLMTIAIFIDNVKAASNDSFYNGEYLYGTYIKKVQSNGIGRYETARFIRRASDGKFAYCLQPFIEFESGKVQTAFENDYAIVTNMTSEQWNRVALLSYYGYQYENHNEDKWYIITQMMIWKTVDPNSDIYFTDVLNGNRISLYESEINEIERLVSNHYKRPSFNGSNHTMSIGSSITLTDSNGVLQNFSITSSPNVTASIVGNNLNIIANKLGDVKLTLTKSDTKYSTPPIVYVDSVSQDLLVVGSYDPLISNVNINIVGGRIKIIKLDSDTNVCVSSGSGNLQGAQYNIIDSNGNVVDTLTIGNDCTATSEILPYGSYIVKETYAGTGYYLDETNYSVNLNSPTTVNLTVKEKIIKGKVKVIKIDKDTNKCVASGNGTLVGAKYQIIDSTGKVADTLTIGADCTATSKELPYGNYTIKEILASTGYSIDLSIYNVLIDSNKTIEITSKEQIIKGKIKLTKFDSDTNACISSGSGTLAGAKYQVIDNNGKVVDTLTIGNDCTATSKELPYGNYSVKEILASTGYYLDSTVYNTEIRNSNTIDIVSEEQIIKGKIKLIKIDNDTKACIPSGSGTLAGAKYQIVDHNGKVVDTLTIGDDCTATSKELPYGNYSVKEILASTGYSIDSTAYNVEIRNSNTIDIISEEQIIKGRIIINKVDSETNICQPLGQAELKNAVFNIIDYKGKVVDTLTIGADCTATSKELPYGKYKIKEITPSKGYYLNTEVFSQFIFENLDYQITVKEDVIKNYISILKQYDYIDGNSAIVNAEQNITFEIYHSDGTKYSEITTDKNGYASINIPYGIWKFHQVNTNTGFEKIYDFYITVDDNSELEQYYNILNNKISAYLQVIKIDSETGKTIALANTTFKILNKDTNQYVSQYVGGKVYDTFLTDENGMFTTYLKLEAGNYKLIELKSPTNYLINKDGLDFHIGSDTEYNYTTYGAYITVYFENSPIKGQIEIYKKGEKFIIDNSTFKYDYISLDGIKFEIYADTDIKSAAGNYLYYNKGDLVDTIYTDSNGYAISKELPLGNYFLVEVETKDNYILDTSSYHFSLVEKNNITPIVYELYETLNYLQKGKLELTKVDYVDGTPISNVKFNIYTINDELIFSGETDENGKINIDKLPLGKYYAVETEPAVSYINNSAPLFFEILDNEQIVKVTMTNKKITSILKIHKIDEENKPISGVEIGIYDSDGNLVSKHITDENGNIEVELEYGKYYYQEITTIDGLVLNKDKVSFEVTEDGAIIEKILINETIRSILKIHKIDEENKPISGVEIGIYDNDGNLVSKHITDENGNIEVELEYGKYYYQEITTIDGLVLNKDKVLFEVTEDGAIIEKILINEIIESILKVHKVDEDDNPLLGVEIGIYDIDGNLVSKHITDENGNIEVKLKYGSYYYMELKALQNYILNSEKYYFEITSNDEELTYTLINEYQKIEIPNTGVKDYDENKVFGMLFILFGIGLIIYGKKQN